YARVAEHCALGGFDGIELQCSHSSIVRGFLSPTTNHRTDRYGGSLDNRARLLLEIVAAVREAIGPRLALGVRLCGDELLEGGTTIEDAVAIARLVDASGRVDYINTSIGVATSTLYMIEASMHIPPGYALFIPSAIRRAVDLPVIGVGRFKDPLQAERALADGHCDLVGVVRGQIADPDFAAKARSGHTADIRLCLSCNQECVGRMGLNRWLGCIENPATGREALLAQQALVTPPAQPVNASTVDGPPVNGAAVPGLRSAGPTTRESGGRRVLVVGAGPAGLQTAITAAGRGCAVQVREREDAAGGQVRLAASVPNRAEFGDLVRNQLAECKRLGVTITYGSPVDENSVREQMPDVVVVATGAEPAAPFWLHGELPAGAPRVADVRDVLTGHATPAGRVVVIDELGFHQATSVAELLADRGCEVEIVTPGMIVGQDLGVTLDLENWCVRAAAKHITQTPDLAVMGVEAGGLTMLHHPTGRTEHLAADWVVLAVAQRPADALYRTLKAGAVDGVAVYRVGDAVAPRRAHAAVIDGDRIGAAL
ncbi:MAG TPA: FAD-dependent oxidoreductase, partial [Kineosporiaceae bacterium]|nr:FAD-dependent oxidoreductase [Kineosporiaceae bacterium]